MEFKKFNDQIRSQFVRMCETGKLFRVDVPGGELWHLYLSSFENESTFRDPESSEHNCNCCKNFIRRYGNIVAIDENGWMQTLFSSVSDVGEYTNPAKALDQLIKSERIVDVFLEEYSMLNEKLNYESCKKLQPSFKLGIGSNLKKYTKEEAALFGVVKAGKIYEFNHFCIDLPKRFVNTTNRSIESIIAEYRDKSSVFKRTMEEISLDTLHLVRDLINQGSLLDGTAHLHSIEEIIPIKQFYDLTPIGKDIFHWITTYDMEERTAKFKNTLIGVLCTELSEGEELNKACLNWNKRVDPANYHKASAPITKKQIETAKEFMSENGYLQSFDRRLATMDDINVSEIKHIATNAEIKPVTVFDSVKATSSQHKRAKFDDVEQVTIDTFMKDILPSCSSIEAYLKNSHEGNLVAITTANDKDSKPIFKWNNNYSWTFNGNLAGKSQIKEAVKTAGGSVTGILRFSIMWAEKDGDLSDLDAHCVEPSGGEHIYFSHKNSRTGGSLDVDIINPPSTGAVENITYPSLDTMPDGVYKFHIKQYSGRNSRGFKAEIEVNGEIYSYEYLKAVRGNIHIAEVTLKDGQFTIKHIQPETNLSKELWNIETNAFHKVSLVCLSPNHWGENKSGNLHYMFMLDKCKATSAVRGFHNENLLSGLLKHRKVMEVLGATNMIEPTNKHLAGLGFNSTVNDELIVKCSGSFKRMLKIKF